ncbi:hypothetical protein GH714_022752 [Hevea brasiliensis]|uniref:Fungal lipase-type domain-containing protein n=1 Tax=Hevea brasiliensis TaxID=3981 RepID=A0A6A6NIY2_HEVBR|nr:hypothetical protein GH714_022752 [Hevea brasiliensis]
MDTLCLKTGIHGTVPSISVSGSLETRSNASQVSAVAREKSTTVAAAPHQKAASRFSFRYPLRSLWPGGDQSNRYKGIAVDDAVLIDNGETKSGAGEDADTRTMGSSERKMGTGCSDVALNDGVNNKEEEECDVCRVEDDDEKQIEFDRDSFSRLLRKVSLAEAKLYLQMSYLGNLAYSIPKIKAETGKDLPKGDYGDNENLNMLNTEMASLMATTDSVTAVVAAKEEVKQAVADDLSSTCSSPCEWFICDDDQGTRFFVIQGSESLASWQANLLFEPVQFEGLDVLVHRGIYEAAKGHSLGGSLALLVNLMLLIRGDVPTSSLLPVITFGAPSIMCGGDYLLRKLGLPRSHVQAITMHRDIVPRAFSCNYPNHVAELLKAVNGNFRNHPCLNNQKLLYAPMGELLILQPDEKFSPHHHLLPSGSGLYFLTCPLSDDYDAEKLLWAAQTLFLNSPHPLEILSDRSAYGFEGTIKGITT